LAFWRENCIENKQIVNNGGFMKRLALITLVFAGLFSFLMANVEWDDSLPIRQGVNIEWSRTAASIDEGVVYVWSDTRHGERDLYAQLISPTGEKLWGEHGLLVSNKPDRQEDPVIITTSDNCVIIAWIDFADDKDGNVFAQKLNADGDMLWDSNGVPICEATGVQISLNIVPDEAGGAIIVWNDERLSEVAFYAQRVSSQGQASWQTDGIRIGIVGSIVTSNTFWEDGSNGAIIAFLAKDGSNVTNIYSARILAGGTFDWGPSLLTNFTSSNNEPGAVRLAPSSNDEFIIAWEQKVTSESGSDYEIFMQKIDIDGEKQFADSGINITNDPATQEKPRISASTNGDFFVTWEDKRLDMSGINPDIFIQKFNNLGNPVWTAPKVAVEMEESQNQVRIASLNDGGCVLVWQDNRNASIGYGTDVYGQKFDTDGNIVWEANGKALASLEGNQYAANVKVLNNDIHFIWANESEGSLSLTQQIISGNNSLLLAENGSDMYTGLSGNAKDMKIFSHGGYAYITWFDGRFGSSGGQIFYQKVDANKNLIFAVNGVAITDENSAKIEYNAMMDSQGNLVFIWLEINEGFEIPKAQKISPTGEKLWGNNGIQLSLLTQALANYHLGVHEINGEYYFYWTDTVFLNNYKCVKGQKINDNGRQWGDNGKTIVNKAPYDEFDVDPDSGIQNIEVKLMGSNNFYLIYVDESALDLYLYKIQANGSKDPQWPSGGVPLAVNPDNYEKDPQIHITNQGVLTLWVDNRNDDNEVNIYSQLFNMQGEPQFVENGVPVAEFPQSQDQFVSKWDGRLTVAWRDFRDPIDNNYNIYAQRFNIENDLLNPIWDADGVGIAVQDSAQTFVDIAIMYDRVLAVWEDAFYDHDIYMGMIDADGSVLGQQISLTQHIHTQTEPKIAKIDHENAYVAWLDYISSGKEEIVGVYMQKVSTGGFTPIAEHNVPRKAVTLYQNYPNPFNPTTTISFAMKNSDRVKLNVYNVKGQKVAELADDVFEQGIHTIVWNGKDNNDKNVASGVYYYQIKSGGHVETRKMLLMK